jgi:AmiR/NasT family two-component response regulator
MTAFIFRIPLETSIFYVVYLTGSHDNTILERAETTKPLGYITKPFDELSLQNSIEIAFINEKTSEE